MIGRGRPPADRAWERGVVLRPLGGIAIPLTPRPGRLVPDRPFTPTREFTHLDSAAYRHRRPRLPRFFVELGHIRRNTTGFSAASECHNCFHPYGWFQVDVCFDKLIFNRHVALKDRLKPDFPTYTPTDLLLEDVRKVVLNFSCHERADLPKRPGYPGTSATPAKTWRQAQNYRLTSCP